VHTSVAKKHSRWITAGFSLQIHKFRLARVRFETNLHSLNKRCNPEKALLRSRNPWDVAHIFSPISTCICVIFISIPIFSAAQIQLEDLPFIRIFFLLGLIFCGVVLCREIFLSYDFLRYFFKCLLFANKWWCWFYPQIFMKRFWGGGALKDIM
jgi:hypothetical protein